eukprot:293421_1
MDYNEKLDLLDKNNWNVDAVEDMLKKQTINKKSLKELVKELNKDCKLCNDKLTKKDKSIILEKAKWSIMTAKKYALSVIQFDKECKQCDKLSMSKKLDLLVDSGWNLKKAHKIQLSVQKEKEDITAQI